MLEIYKIQNSTFTKAAKERFRTVVFQMVTQDVPEESPPFLLTFVRLQIQLILYCYPDLKYPELQLSRIS